MPYITPEGCEHLKHYKYSGSLSSWIDLYVGTPWWEFVVNLLPMWLAPNLITLVAGLLHVVSYWLLWFYCPNMDEAAPSWVYYTVALLFFVYQTLDAVDGKQARRTGAGSPMGHLFDHGCDAFCTALININLCAAMCLGTGWRAQLFCWCALSAFMFSNWEECTTHHMRFGAVSVTEAQLALMACFTATGMFGNQVWTTMIFGFQLKDLMLFIVCLGVIQQIVSSAVEVFKYCDKKGISRASTLNDLVQFFMLFVLGLAWCATDTHHNNPRTVFFVIGMLFSYLVARLITCAQTNMTFKKWHSIMTPFPLVIVNEFTQTVSPVLAMQVYCAFVILASAHFAVSVVRELSAALNISAFTIKKSNK